MIETKHFGQDGFWKQKNFVFSLQETQVTQRTLKILVINLVSFDLAAIPIGGYEPRWFMKAAHVNPEEAVMIHKDINARYSVGIHWGTFILTDEPVTEPPIRLLAALKKGGISKDKFFIMKHGETKLLDFLIKEKEP